MPILILFCLLPLALGAAVEYAAYRFARRKLWRWVPPLVCLAVTLAVLAARFFGWSDTGGAPIETLLFVPGLPAALVFLGLYLGRRLYKRLWDPRVIDDDGKGG
ncbi:Uncharacterised protein [uncultured Flavonifractor sp.]|nr:Uncharacterised protein [uncultured Flavonifractor sp.]